MFAYTEQPVTTFSDYLVNRGGLLGLWFGISAKDLINIISFMFTQASFSNMSNDNIREDCQTDKQFQSVTN